MMLGRADGGEALSDAVRAPYEHSFGYDLSYVRIHTGEVAAAAAASVGARALTLSDHIFFNAGEFDPAGGRLTLGHELAHTVQSRLGGTGPGGRVSDPSWASEREAERAASIAVAGGDYDLTEPGGDDVHRIVPWLILAGIGLVAGIVIWAVSDSPEENRARHEQGAPDPSRDVWALIPVYGSIEQIREADSYFQRVLGVGFLMLDMATLGSAGIAARALVRAPGALVRTVIRREAAGLVVREGGEITSEAAAREAAEGFTRQGGQIIASEAQATAEMTAALERGSVVAVFEGGLNHAAVYARNATGQVVKIHGGPLRVLFATTGREMSQTTLSNIARHANAYAVVEMAEATPGIEAAARTVQEGGPAVLRWIGGNPTSCGIVQGAVLEASGLPPATLTRLIPAGGASARLLPITMMEQMAGAGALRLVEGGSARIIGGTLIQGAFTLGGGAAGPVASSLLRFMVSDSHASDGAAGAAGGGREGSGSA
ncbi:MAG: DUF4157 domain-containing protein, partial [Chloroflexi bacterium]|nr:DUF4157 domain-containing protein [Chloroflexota bacterium]